MITLPKQISKPLKILVQHQQQSWDYRVYLIFPGGTVRVSEHEIFNPIKPTTLQNLLQQKATGRSDRCSRSSYAAVREFFKTQTSFKELARKR